MSRRIIIASNDLMTRLKISQTAERVNLLPEHATSQHEVLEKTVDLKPTIIILDLEDPNFSSSEFYRRIKELAKQYKLRIFAYYPHIRADLKNKAYEASFDLVLPRSSFLANLEKFLNRDSRLDITSSDGEELRGG